MLPVTIDKKKRQTHFLFDYFNVIEQFTICNNISDVLIP